MRFLIVEDEKVTKCYSPTNSTKYGNGPYKVAMEHAVHQFTIKMAVNKSLALL